MTMLEPTGQGTRSQVLLAIKAVNSSWGATEVMGAVWDTAEYDEASDARSREESSGLAAWGGGRTANLHSMSGLTA
jgi:hypothetical protein